MQAKFSRLFSAVLLAICLPLPSHQLIIKQDDVQKQDLDLGSSQDHSFVASANTLSQNLQVVGGGWIGEVIVGQGQKFNVVFDTGSYGMYVRLAEEDTDPGYKPGSATLVSEADTIRLGSGTVSGPVYKDSVTLAGGDNSVQPVVQNFIAADQVPKPHKKFDILGVLGMSIQSASSDPTNLVPVFQAFIRENYANERKFSFYPSAAGVAFTAGGDYPGVQNIINLPVVSGPQWNVGLSSIKVGNNDVNVASTKKAFLDTGSSYINAPVAEFNALLAAVQTTHSTAKISNNYIYAPCGQMPSLSIVFESDQSQSIFNIPGTDLQNTTPENGLCKTHIRSRNGPAWKLGTPFLKNVYSQFNIGTVNGNTIEGFSVGLAHLPAPADAAAPNTAPVQNPPPSGNGGNSNEPEGGSNKRPVSPSPDSPTGPAEKKPNVVKST